MCDLLNYSNKEIFLLSYFLIVNIISFILFAIDKNKAKRKKWRIPEVTLLTTSFLGGATGSLMSMVLFKHKLSKKKFYIGVPLLILLNKVVALWTFNMVK